MPDVFLSSRHVGSLSDQLRGESLTRARRPTVRSGELHPAPGQLGRSHRQHPPPGHRNTYNPAGTGIFGASYPAAAGLYKNLGYLPQGYDGVDNNGNGMIDELAEGAPSGSAAPRHGPGEPGQPHAHHGAVGDALRASWSRAAGRWARSSTATTSPTARCRTPTATACPSSSTPGASPLQFFRWPLLYHSDIQRGQSITQSNAGGTSPGRSIRPT